jgi:hypothetical protein
VSDAINQLLATEAAIDKLGARGISVANRILTLVIELSVQFTLEGDDAVALQRIADDQGERPGEVVRSLIRAASAKAA